MVLSVENLVPLPYLQVGYIDTLERMVFLSRSGVNVNLYHVVPQTKNRNLDLLTVPVVLYMSVFVRWSII